MSQRNKVLLIVLLVACCSGCGTSPAAKFYTLSSTASAAGSPAASYSVGVGPVTVPSDVDRPQLVVQVAPNRVEIDEFSRWASPLEAAIARAIAGNLVVLLGTPDVAVAPIASLTPTYRVTVDVQRFDSAPGEAVVIDAVWAVRRGGDEMQSGRTVARETVADGSTDALAAAHSRALAKVSGDIAKAIAKMANNAG